MAKRPQAVSRYLQHSDQLYSLHKVFKEEEILLREIRQQFPRELTDHITALHMQGQVLTLYVDAPVWASKLHFISGKIAEKAAAREVKIRVSPPQAHLKQKTRKTPPRHSDKAAEVLAEAANYTVDEDLKAVLLRLSRVIRQ